MKYDQLETTYKDDVIAVALYGREKEHFHYKFDAENFAFLLKTDPDNKNLKERLEGSLKGVASTEAICNALRAQITDSAAYAEAVLRTTKKREESNAIRSSK